MKTLRFAAFAVALTLLVPAVPAFAADEDQIDEMLQDLDVDLREWGSSVVALLWRKGEAPEAVHRRHAKERARAEDA